MIRVICPEILNLHDVHKCSSKWLIIQKFLRFTTWQNKRLFYVFILSPSRDPIRWKKKAVMFSSKKWAAWILATYPLYTFVSTIVGQTFVPVLERRRTNRLSKDPKDETENCWTKLMWFVTLLVLVLGVVTAFDWYTVNSLLLFKLYFILT